MNTYGDTDEEPEAHPSVQLKGIRHRNTIPSQGSFQSYKHEQEVSRGQAEAGRWLYCYAMVRGNSDFRSKAMSGLLGSPGPANSQWILQ